MRRTHFITALIISASISTLVVVFQHRSSSQKCSLDGVRIEPRYEVTIIQESETSHGFSCILSAQIWLMENRAPLSAIWVTDEMTGEKIRAELAYYVESDAITTPHTGNRIHVFAQEKDARLHAKQYKGKFVETPLKAQQQNGVKLAVYTPYSPDGTDLILPTSQKPLCLSSNAFLISKSNYRCIWQRDLSQLRRGYATPPDKPPKNLL